MRVQVVIILIFFFNSLFSQDSIYKIKLKTLFTNSFPYRTNNEKVEIEKKNLLMNEQNHIQDSLNNTDFCKNKFAEFELLQKRNNEKVIETKQKVKKLNEENKNSGFYYYVDYICLTSNFDFHGCSIGGIRVRSSDDCDEFELKIKMKGKDRLILDVPSGEVFYYEDLKRTPNK